MDNQPYPPRFTNPLRHPNQSPNLSSASTPASPVSYHHPGHHGSPYAPELKHHRATKSFSSRNTPPPSVPYSPHGSAVMDDRRYAHQSQPPLPPHSHPSHPPMRERRPSYPGERGPTPGWNENPEERFHNPRNYRPHEQQHQGHPLHPPHRDDRPAPPYHRQDNATPPLSDNNNGRNMLQGSPQVYRPEQNHQQREPHPHYAQQGPPPQAQYPAGPSLQSAQQQHHQLQQQLQQQGPPVHQPGPSREPHFASQSPYPPQPQGHHNHSQHQRSASYSDNHHPQSSTSAPYSHHPPPTRPASTSSRPMPPPPSSPHYPRNGQGHAPPAQQYPPPPPTTLDRALPSISSLEIPRPNGMSLSSILGDAPSGPPARLESLSQSIFREPGRGLGPDLSPLKRPFTPGDRPPGGHVLEQTRSNSPPRERGTPFHETRTPPYRHQPSMHRPQESHFSPPPPRPLSQPTYPPHPEPQPRTAPPQVAHPHGAPYHPHERMPERMPERVPERIHDRHERLPEREQFVHPHPHPQFRSQNHVRTSSYPDSPYQRHMAEPRREQSPPRSIQAPPRQHQSTISPPLSQQNSQPQQQTSPSYHHPAPPTASSTALSFNAYTTPMPESPFAITPGLSNQHAIPALHQYDNDRRKPNEESVPTLSDRSHEQKTWDREMERERSSDIPPLRAEEALVKGIHERKYPGSFTNDPVSQSPKLKREAILVEEGEQALRKDDDIEMTGVEGTLSPQKRSEPQIDRVAKRRRPYHTPQQALKSDSTLSNLEEALNNTPTKPLPYTSSPAPTSNPVPSIPPQQTIDSSTVTASLKDFKRSHLGSMVYSLTVMKKTGTVKSYSHIPLFQDRENCTFTIRIPWYTLSLEERERVCKKRLVWGAEVYTDDSNILAVLIHEGHIPGVRDGQELAEYASAHDTVVAKMAAPKKRGTTARQKEIAAMLAEGLPKTSRKIQERKDLLVTIVICGNLTKYSSVLRYGLKSRSWEGHDGMSFIVENVSWVDDAAGFGDNRGGVGVHQRLGKWEKMRKANETIQIVVTDGKTKEVLTGSKWLAKESNTKNGEEKENEVMQVDAEAEPAKSISPETKEPVLAVS